MKYQTKQLKLITRISASIILVLSIAFLIFLFRYSDSELHRTSTNLIKESMDLQLDFVDSSFDTLTDVITSITDSVSYNDSNIDSVSTYIKEQRDVFNFVSITYIDTNGNLLSTTNQDVSSLTAPPDSTFDDKDIAFSQPFLSATTDDYCITIYSKVYENDSLKGYLVFEYSMSAIMNNLTAALEENGYALITDSKGYAFLSTDKDYIDFDSFVDAEFLDDNTDDTVIKNLKEGTSGMARFNLENIDYVVSYTPLNLNDWFLVLVINEDTVATDIRILATVLITFVMSVFVGFLLFLLYFWYSKRTLELVAYYDELTNLPNLAKLKLIIEEKIKKYPNEQFVIVKMDIDNFKAINEVYGFNMGDKVLKSFQKTAATVEEKSFSIARTSGDEFMMFSGNGLLENLDTLRIHYEAYFKQTIPELKDHYLSFNYGRYYIESAETDINEIITKVSIAHAMSKEIKKGKIKDYDNAYKDQLRYLTEVTNKMEYALATHEFVPYLQPKVRLSDNHIIGAEALVRWIEKDGAIVLPNVFIPLFESNGFIQKLDKYILERVCILIKNWIKNGYECVPVSVNFSRMHFINPNFANEIIDIVDRYNIPHKYIEIEITETTILENKEAVKNQIVDLRSSGFSISIDDFGAGYSSLGMLKDFKVDTLKLDRSFFLNESKHENGNLVVDGVIKLGHSLNMSIVAEGVEEESQAEFLLSLNCEYAQGYHFARPMPIEEFNRLYLTTI